ncbi:hypothetical protein MKX08_006440 [Trichoderma sp. CBMAI-0020]|nr:hypothetical protein MKX08_006440 [Trichoderma sp. CBMAI-0020]
MIHKRLNFKGKDLTSALANLGNSLLKGQTCRPSNNLLALKFVLLLIEAVQLVAHDVEKTLSGTNKGTKGKHDGRKSKNTAAHETSKGGGPGILLLAQVHHRSGEESIGTGTRSYMRTASSVKSTIFAIDFPPSVETIGPIGAAFFRRLKAHTANANDGSSPRKDAQSADVAPRHGILDGRNEEAASQAD